jgi:hypothetical protein
MLDIPPDTVGSIVTAALAVIFVGLVALMAWWMRK